MMAIDRMNQVAELPTVTVVIPCYNQGRYAYEAVLSSTRAYAGPLDIIIVNDGSSEASIHRTLQAVSDELSSARCRIRVIHQSNKGLPGARNVAISRAEGTFVQLLDADDLLLEGKIDDQIAHFAIARSIDVSITDFLQGNESLDEFMRHDGFVGGWNYTLKSFAMNWERGFSIPVHCALFRKEILDRVPFDEKVKAKEDWVLWTTIVSQGGRIAYLGSRAAIYRVHENSMCRSMASIGRQWLTAAIEIDRLVSPSLPDFLPNAVDWYQRYYAKSIHNEIESNTTIFEKQQITTRSESSESFEFAPRLLFRSDLIPEISIIVPVFNHFEYLQECFESISAQIADFDAGAVQVVLVDDASSDDRVQKLLDRIAGRAGNLRVLRNQTNMGISRTQNLAVSVATGRYIAFLDCDDALPPGALARAMAFIETSGGCDYFFSDRWDVDSTGKRIRLARYGGYGDERFVGELRRDLLNGMVASHLKIIRRSSFEAAGGFDEKFSGIQDWELALKILKFGTFLYLPEPLYLHRIHDRSVTSSDRRGQLRRTNLARRKFAEELLDLRIRKSEAAAGFKTHLSGDNDLDILPLAEAWEKGPVCLDATGKMSGANLWRLREFNSYVDEIVWSEPETYAGLLGYVWSPDILKRARIGLERRNNEDKHHGAFQ